MKNKQQWMEERFEELISKDYLTLDNLMELEDMSFVEKISPLNDHQVIIKKNGKEYVLNTKEEN